MEHKQSVTSLVKEIKRRTRRLFSSEEKIKIGLRGEDSIKEVCRKYAIHETQYYKWSKDFIEAGKKRLSGDTAREANTEEVSEIKKENSDLKETVAELLLQNKVLKKSLNGLE